MPPLSLVKAPLISNALALSINTVEAALMEVLVELLMSIQVPIWIATPLLERMVVPSMLSSDNVGACRVALALRLDRQPARHCRVAHLDQTDSLPLDPPQHAHRPASRRLLTSEW